MSTLDEIAVTTEVYQRLFFFPDSESSLKYRGTLDLMKDRGPGDFGEDLVGLCTQFKSVEGKLTNVPSVTFMVKRKKGRTQLSKSRQMQIPAELPAFDVKRKRFSNERRVKTDVEECDGIFLGSPAKRGIYVARQRPVVGGLSIGNARRQDAGTVGFWIELLGKGIVGISNYHVLASSDARKGERIVQPGLMDHSGPRNTIGRLLEFFEYKNGPNLVDLACVAAKNPSAAKQNHIEAIGKCNGFIRPAAGMRVAKVGRTTGYTEGEILALDATFKAPYGKKAVVFVKQLKTNCEMGFGDSGAALVALKSKKICGLCMSLEFIGNSSYAFANNIRYLFGEGSVSGWKLKPEV